MDRFSASTEAELIVFGLILLISFACLVFLLLAIARRLLNKSRYLMLDHLRAYYRPRLRLAASAGESADTGEFRAGCGSLKWTAVEDVLFMLNDEDGHPASAGRFFESLGYISYYEKELSRRNRIRKASAIDKLGRMDSRQSAAKILSLLKNDDPEIIAVSVRAICRLGEASTLRSMLEALPDLLARSLVSDKTVVTSLLRGGPDVASLVLDFGLKCRDPRMLSLILEVLHSRTVTREVFDFARVHLSHEDPEVRSKSLKVLAACHEECEPLDIIVPLLKDPVWFVRLQAVRALGVHQRFGSAREIGALVLDERWQVRNAAAVALTRLGDVAIDVFLELLRSTDRYAKESICEEIEKSDFVELLFERLDGGEHAVSSKAREILIIMASLNFSSPLQEIVEKKDNQNLAEQVNGLLHEAAVL